MPWNYHRNVRVLLATGKFKRHNLLLNHSWLNSNRKFFRKKQSKYILNNFSVTSIVSFLIVAFLLHNSMNQILRQDINNKQSPPRTGLIQLSLTVTNSVNEVSDKIIPWLKIRYHPAVAATKHTVFLISNQKVLILVILKIHPYCSEFRTEISLLW